MVVLLQASQQVPRDGATDDDEMLFDAMRPILINGIENVGTRGDLVDRAIILLLEPIAEEARKSAKQLQAEFDAAAPRIFGAILDAMVYGLRALPEIKLEKQPRMADFALWSTACEGGLQWESGKFMGAYEANRAESNEDVIDSSPFASSLRAFLDFGKSEWVGTAGDLLNELAKFVGNEAILKNSRLWPQTGRALSQRLNRDGPALRRGGIEIERLRGNGNTRLMKIYRIAEALNFAPLPPAAPHSVNTAKSTGSG